MTNTDSLTAATAIRIAKGDRFHGLYMGFPFAGTVTEIEANASGYASDDSAAPSRPGPMAETISV